METIVVTAQSRAQSIQDVSIAIDATAGNEFSERIIVDVENFVYEVPSLTIAESPFQRSVAIRGVGSTGGNIGYEQSAPFFIDGVFAGRAQQFSTVFFDLDRIEVIKGPQAIFFGKNATAGAVSINSARPTSEFYASINGGYEVENDGYYTQGILSGPLADRLRGRVAVLSSRRGDYLFDSSLDTEVGQSSDFGARLGLEWDPTDDLSFYLKAEHMDREADRRVELACANPGFRELTVAAPRFPPGSGLFPAVTVDCVADGRLSSGAAAPPFQAALPPGSDFSELSTTNIALKMEWSIGEHTAELLSAYAAYESENVDGLDRSAASIATSNTVEDFRQYSQEVRILSPTGGRFEYVVGGLYLDQQQDMDQTIAQLVPLPVPVGDLITVSQNTTAYSLFGQLTWNITDSARLKAGFRYTNEDKDYDSAVARSIVPSEVYSLVVDNPPATIIEPLNFGPFALADSNPQLQDLNRSEEQFDPAVTLEVDILDDSMVYLTVARGTKAGGFEFLPRGVLTTDVDPSALEYEEEEALNYELGLKSRLAGGRWILNAAGFYTELNDLQTQVLNIADVSFITLNIPESLVSGLEIDSSLLLNENLTIGAALTWLADAQVDEAPASQPQFENNRLPFAPEWAGNLFLRGEWELSSGMSLTAFMQGNYTGSREFEVANLPADKADSFFTLDARLGLSFGDGYEFYINGRNLLDNDDILLNSNGTLLGLVGTPAGPGLPPPAAGDPRGILFAEDRTVMVGLRKEF